MNGTASFASIIDVWLGMFNAMLITRCIFVCVCVSSIHVLSVPLVSVWIHVFPHICGFFFFFFL